MKVVHVVPGSGGTFYCQNCLRDISLVRALRRKGHDVIMVPLYLPSPSDVPDIDHDAPVFFGGINVYLQEKCGLFRYTPRWLDKLFDLPWMLRRAAKREGSTKAAGLGSMTLSMLKGRDGNQKKELDRLIEWLADQEHPDIVHISNALLIGLASEIKRALNVPVICSLQDEDVWLDAIDPPYNKLCWDAIAKRTGDVDTFVAVSRWYADRMAERTGLSREAVQVVHIGVDLDDLYPADLTFDPPTIGYLSKMTESLGLGKLVDAFIELKRRPGLENLRLRATGGITRSDKRFVAQLTKRLVDEGMMNDVEFLDEFDKGERQQFFKSLSVLSVPASQGEAFGTYIIEALVHGVPVVQPAVGAFPELIKETGGGVLYESGGLVDGLESLLRNPDRARDLGRHGCQVVREEFNIDKMADRMITVYEKALSK
jgi:glycosyltransferase involved in cell wall biosynthesis